MDGSLPETTDFDATWDEQPFGAPMPRAFRLVDAERIAARRLEGAAEGSLQEALATVIVTAEAEGHSLNARLQQFATETSAQTIQPQPHPAPAIQEADFGWFGAVPPAHAVPCFEVREFGDTVVVEAVALAPPPVSMPPVADLPPVLAPALTPDMPPNAPDERPADAEAFVHPEPHPVMAMPNLLPPVPPLVLPEDPNLEPIVTAYAASARLAADAAAASQALFELQKLLNQQKLEASPELTDAMQAHGLAGLDAIPVAQQPAPETMPETVRETVPEPLRETLHETMPEIVPAEERVRAPDPVTDVTLVPPRLVQSAPQRLNAAPPPLPAPMPVALREAPMPSRVPASDRPTPASPVRTQSRGPSQSLAARPSQPTPVRTERRRAPPPTRQRRTSSTFDFQGFAAGFALSGAIGVVLYFVVATS